ncbi:MAG: c-type cytochrome [Pseudolabrys sp.]
MRKFGFALLASLAVAGGVAVVSARAKDTSFATIERGRHLADAADCAACHTAKDGKPFAGGEPVPTPFGSIQAPNITPDRETGIGAWTDAEFYRALHDGVGPHGERFYPAFPYPYYTKMTRDDVLAIRAYLNTIPPVKYEAHGNHIAWPLRYRVFMRGWNLAFFDRGTFQPDPNKSAEWNRGAYLVEGAGHCGACHTPKNVLGGDKTSENLRGATLDNWFAPDITNDAREGLGAWSAADIAEYLATGRNKYNAAAGEMAEVVKDSTSKVPAADLHAIAVYLKSLEGAPSSAPPTPLKQDDKMMVAGRAIYADSCAACHEADGKGVSQIFPPLERNASVQAHDPTTLIRVILQGANTPATDKRPTPFAMPAYNWKLKDDEIAAVITYIRNSWGNAAPAVTAKQVSDLRAHLLPPTQ